MNSKQQISKASHIGNLWHDLGPEWLAFEVKGQSMRRRSLFILIVALASLLLPSPPPAHAAAVLELYGTFHAMGLTVTIATGDDPDQDAVANVVYRVSESGAPYRQGYPLSRVGSTHFVGSLFWLEPGTTYDVRVTFVDPDGALDGVSLSKSGATRDEIVIPTPNHSFYVSPSGSGTACSLLAPCALAEGLNQAGPGDEVVLRGGVYYEGEIDLPDSGTPGAPLVIRSDPGETAILDGADPATFTWTHEGSGVYRATVNVADTQLVAANGQRLYPYHSLSDLQDLVWGIPGLYVDGVTVYVRLKNDANPNDTEMVVSRYNEGFYMRDWTIISNLTFRHYGQGEGARALTMNNATDNLVQGCTFALNDTGIVIKYGSHRNVIQNNEFYDTISRWPWDAVKESTNLGATAIRWGSSAPPTGNVVRYNIVHGMFDGLKACPYKLDKFSLNESDFYGNTIYDAGDDGIQADGLCGNVRIWGNTIHDVLSGISLAPAYPGPVYAIRNLIYRIDDSPFKFNFEDGLSGPMYLFHNTCNAVLPDTDGLWIGQPGSWERIHARNNIWAGTAFALKNTNTSQPVDLDYDDLWNGNSSDLVRWGSTNHDNLADFIGATGQELHGLSVLPGFTDAESDDYTLDPTSDLIDAGVVIPGVNDDYVGAAPDIGAFEYEGYGFTLSVTPPSRAIDPGEVATYTLEVQPTGGFSTTVNLFAASPSSSLTLDLVPTGVVPPGQATLTIADSHTGTLLPGLWHTVPITATAGDVRHVTSVGLLVGGARGYLPIVLQ